MVFLDKSARTGAFIFNTLWNELESAGELTSIQKPDIRFMNIGKSDVEKHESKASLVLLKDKFKNTQFPENEVLIVDEYVESGGSIRRASKTIEDEFEIKPNAIAQFEEVPKWCSFSELGITGITDNDRRYQDDNFFDDKFDSLRQLEGEEALALKGVVDKHAEDFQKFYRTLYYLRYVEEKEREKLTPEEFYYMGVDNVTDEDIDIIDKIIGKSGNLLKFYDGGLVEEFVQSAGGFLAKPLAEAWQRDNNTKYRHVLKLIVQAYVSRKNMASSSIKEIPDVATEKMLDALFRKV